jgi:serine/threonine protein kinase
VATCSNCGSELRDADVFCATCGTPTTRSAPPTYSPMAPSPGPSLLGRLQQATAGEYEVLREIGRGGMAAVFLAKDIRLDRHVALKVMLPELIYKEGMAQRFRREAMTAAKLEHPNIVVIYSVREAADLLFFAMKYVEGSSLAGIIRGNAPLPVEVATEVLLEIAAALSFAHGAGVVHRDVKPGNVLIDGKGTVLVTDFGIAKAAESPSLTQTGAVIGTPAYMSPEQCLGVEVGPASDQYALGVIGYEMLTGRSPFTGSAFEIQMAHVSTPPRPITEVRPDTPESVSRAVMRMLAKAPDERFGSMREVVDALGNTPFDSRQANARLIGLLPVAKIVPVASSSTEVGTRVGGSEWTIPPVAKLEPETNNPASSTGVFAGRPTSPPTPDFPVAVTVIAAGNDTDLLGARIRCAAFPFSIGRASANSLTIPGDLALSRTHATIEVNETGFVIRDASTNGIYVNGRLLRGGTEPLRIGAMVALSRATAIRFVPDMPALPDASGQVVGARFRLEERLYSSVKAATYRATDQRLHRDVTVKLFSPTLMRFAQYRDEFLRQGDIAAKLQHPHICGVLDVAETTLVLNGRSEQVCYLCTEFMPGGSLASRLVRGVEEPLASVVSWIGQIAAALEHAHRQGIVHGDIKPSCVVFDLEGVPYLTDFALARSKDRDASPAIVGSPDYLAPEQWAGQAPTRATDQYSLAVLAYLLVTGSLPHERQDDPAVRDRNLRRGALPAHTEAAARGKTSVPESISPVLDKALRVDASERYESIGAFGAAFRDAFVNTATTTRPTRVFLSYQRQASGAWAILVARVLEEKYALSVFVDTRALDGAPRIPDRLRDEIARCDVFVCLLSGTTLESSWVRQEIELAMQHQRPVVPILQEDFKLPAALELNDPNVTQLLAHQHIWLFDRRNIHVEMTIAELGERIRAMAGR